MVTLPQPTNPTVDLASQKTYVSFSGPINLMSTQLLIQQLFGLVAQGMKEIHLLLSTPGGEVMSGIALYNTLRGLPVHLTTHNVGNVDSIGTAVFLAGEERLACAQATFMFHGVGLATNGVQQFQEKRLLEHLHSIQADQARINAILQERTRLSARECESLSLQQQTKDASYAVAHGIADRVEAVQIPAGSRVVPVVVTPSQMMPQ
jgi:ATP-dependent Clp protease protease subunit